jgi:hypothetical protein
MAKTRTQDSKLGTRPVNRYHVSDSLPNIAFDLNVATPSEMAEQHGLSAGAVKRILVARRRGPITGPEMLAGEPGLTPRDRHRIRCRGLGASDTRFAITDVQPIKGYVFSHKPFALRVRFINPGNRAISLASVRTQWRGQPFVVETGVTSRNRKAGYVDVNFHRGQTLPPGPSTFHVDLYDDLGGQSSFKVTCVVLSSNPLSLSLSPTTYYVTGTYSLRGYYASSTDEYKTYVRLSVYNGSASSVTMSRSVSWKFWDGGVGGTLKGSGTHTWSSGITVPGYGSWSGTLIFTSPRGSPTYDTYDRKEDMTLEIGMTTSGGTGIGDTITARVMAGFGVDIIRVASDTFVGQEYTDLYNAVEVLRDIYEARDISLRGVGRYHVTDSDAGGYKYMNSSDECHDLFGDWSANSGGNYLDAFVAHDFVGVSFDGRAGDIPGPTSHSGRKSGVVVDKTGYTDGSGVKRLSVDYLGMLLAHELGHYLGLEHVSTDGNLMLSNSGTYDTDLTYDQYRTILAHGWVFVD